MSVLDRVHKEATRTPVTDITRRLQELLGQRSVAFAADVRSAKSVGHWVTGTKPAPDAEQRLRTLFQAVLVLSDESDETKRAWLLGTNPGLDDRSPLEVVREGHGSAVMRAAQAFTQ